MSSSIKIADALCSDPVIGQDFSSVEIIWVRRQRLDSQSFFQHKVHLMIYSREYMVKFFSVPNSIHYEIIASFPDNFALKSYLWSRHPDFALTEAFMTGKTVGLLNEPHSQGKYKMPMAALANSNIPQNKYQIKFFNSLSELHQAHDHGEVDIITVSTFSPEKLEGSALYLGDTETAAIYLTTELAKSPVACALINQFDQLRGQVLLPYWDKWQSELDHCTPEQTSP